MKIESIKKSDESMGKFNCTQNLSPSIRRILLGKNRIFSKHAPDTPKQLLISKISNQQNQIGKKIQNVQKIQKRNQKSKNQKIKIHFKFQKLSQNMTKLMKI